MRYLATHLIYIAVMGRAIGWSQDSIPIPVPVWVLLIIFGINLFLERGITRRLAWFPRLYTVVQSGLTLTMLYIEPELDILTMLFLPLSFQVVQFFRERIGFTWIGGYTLAMTGMFFFGLEWEQGIVMILLSTGANGLMGSYAYLMEKTEQEKKNYQELFGNLQGAYQKLKISASQAESLAVSEERLRLVRELHDSLTQTLFSMNLAVQAAQVSAEKSPRLIEEPLTRLQDLVRSAAQEVKDITEPVRSPTHETLETALRGLAQERRLQDGLEVTLEVVGQRYLSDTVTNNLYRITQEAFNNIVRHAGTCQTIVRLVLDQPQASLEIIDEGCGFSNNSMNPSKGYGLTGMAERAKVIGWDLTIESHLGQGTRIRLVEKPQ